MGLGHRPIFDKVIKIAYNNLDMAPKGPHRHFTFIVRRNKIIVFGVNFYTKTHTINQRYGYQYNNIHSEGHAVISFPHNRSDLPTYDFYNVRINKRNEIALSAPCEHCRVLLRSHGIQHIYYTTNEGTFERMSL